MTEEYIHGMSDAVVRKMPTDSDFRHWLTEFGIGHHAAPNVGKHIAMELARKWQIVLLENSDDK